MPKKVKAFSKIFLYKKKHDNKSKKDEWTSWKNNFNKKYSSNKEEMVRQKIWLNNMNYIRKHNSKADNGLFSYRLGMNEFGDLVFLSFFFV